MAPLREKQLSSLSSEESIYLPPFNFSISFADQFNNNSLAKKHIQHPFQGEISKQERFLICCF
jgi:hypothetical protein